MIFELKSHRPQSYFSRSSDSTEILFLLAIRLSVTRGRIVTPHARLHLEPLTAVYANML